MISYKPSHGTQVILMMRCESAIMGALEDHWEGGIDEVVDRERRLSAFGLGKSTRYVWGSIYINPL